MKKLLVIYLATAFLLCGCDNSSDKKENKKSETPKVKVETQKLSCLYKGEDMVASAITATVEYDNNDVLNVEYVYTLKDDAKEFATTLKNQFESSFKNNSNVSSKFNDSTWTITYNFKNMDMNKYKEADTEYKKFISSTIEPDFSYISNDKVSLDTYKSIVLEDYECK